MALSGAAGSAVNSAVSAAQGAKQSSDSRLAALQGTQAVLSGVQAGQAVALDQAKGTAKDNTNTIGVSASLAHSPQNRPPTVSRIQRREVL